MLHDNQFVISDSYFTIGKKQWKSIEMSNGKILSYSPMLDMHGNESNNIFILGFAWQTDETRRSPYEEIKSLDAGVVSIDQIYDMEQTWCGRYLLIYGDWVLLDTFGSLGAFYIKEGSISSSVKLLQIIKNQSYTITPPPAKSMPKFI